MFHKHSVVEFTKEDDTATSSHLVLKVSVEPGLFYWVRQVP